MTNLRGDENGLSEENSTMLSAQNLSLVALSLAALAMTGCVYTHRSAQISAVGVDGSVKYRVVGKVEGQGKASFSPILLPFLTLEMARYRAEQDALGQAIYDRDDVDAVVAPKTEHSDSNFLLIGFYRVKLRGVGVQILPSSEK
ncbi:MAG: hypothetical protein N3B15_00215 [Planctomycetota bacterium]|nr:hypothetical protein [Planctomycetota bacterium]